MAMTSGQFADLYDSRMKKIFFRNLIDQKKYFAEVANEMSTEKKYELMSSVAGLGYVPQSNEGATYTSDQLVQKYDKTFTPLTYKVNVRITKEAQQDDLSGTFTKIPAMLARSAMATVNRNFALMFDRSQSGSYLGPDGKALCVTDHPLHPDTADTYSNRPSANAVLSLTAIENAVTAQMGYTDDRGIPGDVMSSSIMIPTASYIAASKYLESQKVTGSANNDKNVVNNLGLKLIVNPFLTDTDSWYVLADKSINELFVLWREKPNSKLDSDVNTDDAIYKIRFRVVDGWVDARYVYGSTGA